MELPTEPDLFGYVAPARPTRARRVATGVNFDECVVILEEELSWLAEEISEAVSDLQMSVVGLVDDEHAGEVDGLIEALEEELSSALRAVRGNLRRKVLL